MPDAFDETLTASSDAFFQLPGAEYVTYVPASGSARRIRAVIYRPGPEQLAGRSGGSRPAVEVLVRNSSTAGIASTEIDTGGDKINVAANVNEKPETMRIVEVLNHDAGCVLLKVQ